jgi:hypothetical protein
MGNEMYHYGVKGMRWGVRKERKLSKRQRRHQAELNYKKRQQELLNKSVSQGIKARKELSEMSDDELNRRYQRLMTEKNVKRLLDELDEDQYVAALNRRIATIETERKYKSLTNPASAATKSAGKKFLEESLPGVGKMAVGTVTTLALTAAVSKALKVSSREAVKFVAK